MYCFLTIGERVSGKGADLYEMCDELDAILRGTVSNYHVNVSRE